MFEWTTESVTQYMDRELLHGQFEIKQCDVCLNKVLLYIYWEAYFVEGLLFFTQFEVRWNNLRCDKNVKYHSVSKQNLYTCV